MGSVIKSGGASNRDDIRFISTILFSQQFPWRYNDTAPYGLSSFLRFFFISARTREELHFVGIIRAALGCIRNISSCGLGGGVQSPGAI